MPLRLIDYLLDYAFMLLMLRLRHATMMITFFAIF